MKPKVTKYQKIYLQISIFVLHYLRLVMEWHLSFACTLKTEYGTNTLNTKEKFYEFTYIKRKIL